MGAGLKDWAEYAKPLGELIARFDAHLLTGGGDGTMSCVSEAFIGVEGRLGQCLGIVKTQPCDVHGFVPALGYPNPYVEIPIYTPLSGFNEQDPEGINRNHINILTSDVLVILPGGKGTENEAQIAYKYKKPALFYTPSGFYDHLQLEIEQTSDLAVVERFLKNVIN